MRTKTSFLKKIRKLKKTRRTRSKEKNLRWLPNAFVPVALSGDYVAGNYKKDYLKSDILNESASAATRLQDNYIAILQSCWSLQFHLLHLQHSFITICLCLWQRYIWKLCSNRYKYRVNEGICTLTLTFNYLLHKPENRRKSVASSRRAQKTSTM